MENILDGVLSSGLSNMLTSMLNAIPTFLMAIVIVIFGNIISKMTSKGVGKVLSKIGIDKLGDGLNDIELVQKLNTDIKISSIFSKILYYFIFFIFLMLAADVLDMPAITQLIRDAFDLIPKIIVGLIILIFGTLLADMLKNVVTTALESLAVPSAKLIGGALFYFLFINVVILAIAQADINTAFLEQNLSIIIAGIVVAFAIGYGLASKDMVANFLGSFYTQGKINVGDTITVEDVTGIVKDIDRNSLVLEAEGKEIIIPLSLIMKQKFEIRTHN